MLPSRKHQQAQRNLWCGKNRKVAGAGLRMMRLSQRDKTSLDITWIKDKSLTDLDNLPDPDVLAEEIIENLEAGIEGFREIMATLNGK